MCCLQDKARTKLVSSHCQTNINHLCHLLGLVPVTAWLDWRICTFVTAVLTTVPAVDDLFFALWFVLHQKFCNFKPLHKQRDLGVLWLRVVGEQYSGLKMSSLTRTAVCGYIFDYYKAVAVQFPLSVCWATWAPLANGCVTGQGAGYAQRKSKENNTVLQSYLFLLESLKDVTESQVEVLVCCPHAFWVIVNTDRCGASMQLPRVLHSCSSSDWREEERMFGFPFGGSVKCC